MKTGNGTMSKGFTLIELLIVVAIIAVLAAMLLPVLRKAREKAEGAACMSNLKQIGVAVGLYCADWRDRLPYQGGADYAGAGTGNWLTTLLPYLEYKVGSKVTPPVLVCPSQASPQAAWGMLFPGVPPFTDPYWGGMTNYDCAYRAAYPVGSYGTYGGSSPRVSYAWARINGSYPYTMSGAVRSTIDHPSDRLMLVETNGAMGYVYGLNQVAYRHGGQCNALFVDGHAGIIPDEAKKSYTNVYWGKYRGSRSFDDYSSETGGAPPPDVVF